MDEIEIKLKYKDRDIADEKVTLWDLGNYLDDECPVINGNEDFGVDSSEADYSIDSSISYEDEQGASKKDSVNPDVKLKDISLDDILSNPFEEAPEFYPSQLDFGTVKDLPGTQKLQLQHKEKTLLKNKYWGKLARSIYDIGSSKLPKASHLNKMLELYIINQEKLKSKRKKQETPKRMRAAQVRKRSKPVKRHIFSSMDLVGRALRKVSTYGSAKMDAWLRFKKKSSNKVALTNSGLGATTWFGNSAATHAASTEIKRRINNLDKRNCKVDTEKLARESKSMMIRMPAFKSSLSGTLLCPYFDTEYPKMVCKYLFSQGFISKWKTGK
eukprot:TRINITY_DN11326_c0_g2_i1.p1 TRINITY_DN11326_c0_g2~~TRINITY_DN11326_c0_g2_i1.p1  ORF type:complete len:328 (-),score=92.88 TRINITY_DN11326_c0_g2_i1:117-1100(-)